MTRTEIIGQIRKTPIVYTFLPEEWKTDREIALEFIKSNLPYAEAYHSGMRKLGERYRKEGKLLDSSVGRENFRELFLNGVPREFPKELGAFSGDGEFLSLLGSSPMWECVAFTDENYDEKMIVKSICKGYCLVNPLFDYWAERLLRDKKTAEHVRETYHLQADEPMYSVTVFKCLKVIDGAKGDKADAVSRLMRRLNEALVLDGIKEGELIGFFAEHGERIGEIFRSLPVGRQNSLAHDYYAFAQFLRPQDIEPKLAEEIAKGCRMAYMVLPDEYILRYDLHYDCAHRDCTGCPKCALANMLIV